MLLRHWTLLDSINNSNYLVSQLQLWTEQGQRELMRLLASVGVPIEQAKQKFQFIDSGIRSSLKDKMLENSHQFGLDDILVNSYVKQIDPKTQISALDSAYALSSIIECPFNVNRSKFDKFSKKFSISGNTTNSEDLGRNRTNLTSIE